jgi:hypothetical protein
MGKPCPGEGRKRRYLILQIIRPKAGVLGNSCKQGRSNLLAVMEGENIIFPSLAQPAAKQAPARTALVTTPCISVESVKLDTNTGVALRRLAKRRRANLRPCLPRNSLIIAPPGRSPPPSMAGHVRCYPLRCYSVRA